MRCVALKSVQHDPAPKAGAHICLTERTAERLKGVIQALKVTHLSMERCFHFVRTSAVSVVPFQLVKGFSCSLLLLLSSCAIGSSIYRFILCAVRKCFIYMWTTLAAKFYLNMRSRPPSRWPNSNCSGVCKRMCVYASHSS